MLYKIIIKNTSKKIINTFIFDKLKKNNYNKQLNNKISSPTVFDIKL